MAAEEGKGAELSLSAPAAHILWDRPPRDDQERQERIRELRVKVAQKRLERLDIQEKRARVRAMRERWMGALQKIHLERSIIQEQRSGTAAELGIAIRSLESMSQMNAANDCFFIWHAGPFGTINGFRLGKLPVESVDWSEINAALGQVALLLATIEMDTTIQFSDAVYPKGSYSYLRSKNSSGKVDDKSKIFELYKSDEFFKNNSKFDTALERLLRLVKEAGVHIQGQDPTFTFPYPINDDSNTITISDYPISIAKNGSDELWTRALKFFLTDVKWVVAWAAKHSP